MDGAIAVTILRHCTGANTFSRSHSVARSDDNDRQNGQFGGHIVGYHVFFSPQHLASS